MLNFSRLTQLNEHTIWLQSQMQTEDFYLVGGIVRDLLLGVDKEIVDIDITGPHHPDQWRDNMKSEGVSRFRTEKFGTMTMARDIKKKLDRESSLIEKVDSGYYIKSNLFPVFEGAEEQQRDTIGIIIKHWSEDKYLVAQRPNGQQRFPGGGVEKGETIEDAAVREMLEETGYSDYRIVTSNFPLFEVYFHHPTKKYNLRAFNHGVVIHLLSDNQSVVTEEEKNKHQMVRVDGKNILTYLHSPVHQCYWTRYQALQNGTIDLDIIDNQFVDDWNNGINKIPLKSQISYEITPFRQEGGYEDFRHPGEIQWSDSLLDDAKRRDFTINCLYYKKLEGVEKSNKKQQGVENAGGASQINFDPEKYIKQGYRYDEASGTLCVCDHEKIQLIQNGDTSARPSFNTFCYLIVDPYQGLVDLCEGNLRCVGDPDHRFQEDALRILRGLRFVNTLNQTSQIQWDFHRDTWRSMQKYHFLVQHLAKERIKQEITKVFAMKNPFGYVALLDELKLLPLIFPSVAKIKGLEQPVRYHPLDTYHHTLMTLWHLQKLNDNYLVKLAMLYHDVGKVEQYKLYNIGLTKDEISIVHGSWLNHTVCGPDFVRRDFAALGFSNAEIDYIAWLVQYHMYPGQILMAKPENQIKKLRTLLAESSYEQMCDLIDVVEGDRLGHYNPMQSQVELAGPEQLRIMLDKIYHDEGQITLKSLTIDGQTLMSELSIEPSKILGQLLKKCLDYVLSDPSRNTREELIRFSKKEYKKINL